MVTQLSPVRAKVWLHCFKHSPGTKGSLSTNIIREICSYFANLKLLQVTSTFLRFFNCEISTWEQRVSLDTKIKADEYSSWLILKDGRLLCSGGGNHHIGYSEGCKDYSVSWKKAYIIDYYGIVDSLPRMISARSSHGIIEVQQLVYVFGGSKI